MEEWNREAIDLNVGLGMEHLEFTPEVVDGLKQAALDNVLPGWVTRVGGPESEGAALFNEKVGPIVEVLINSDGKSSKIK